MKAAVITYYSPLALLPEGFRENARITVDEGGWIRSVGVGVAESGDLRLAGPVLPGMPNLHSHAFQRAMAGLAETALDPQDSFWTWRDLMYRLVGRLTPDQVQAIATRLYIEMLKAGYTAVAEFHYLHHDRSGVPFADPAEMSGRIVAAADAAGIGLTLLPALYAHGGFGGQEPSEKQRRFIHDVDGYSRLLDRVRSIAIGPNLNWGLCFHSLRAVTGEEIAASLDLDPGRERPVHIHIAEQTKEVEDCLAWSGRRPIQWLFDHFGVDQRWCLVHATHADEDEVVRMAEIGAVVGLCPTTEANLGDGIFPAVEFANHRGAIGIGSDSHVSLSVVEELRWLEYGQRLRDRRRNRLAPGNRRDVALYLYQESVRGGAKAAGRDIGAIAIGKRADFIVLDGNHPMLARLSPDQVLGRWLFGGQDSWVKDVAVGGRWLVKDGTHIGQESADRAFASAIGGLLSD
jgi:formimidoylglutamate deiminase